MMVVEMGESRLNVELETPSFLGRIIQSIHACNIYSYLDDKRV